MHPVFERLVITHPFLGILFKKTKGVLMVARGEHFNHKNKNHPGNFPENNVVQRHTTEAQEDEELLVTQEAFKNRIEEEE
jgi:hypothetical protein